MAYKLRVNGSELNTVNGYKVKTLYYGGVAYEIEQESASVEDELAGTWVFNDDPNTAYSRNYSLNFTSNNNQYNYIKTNSASGLIYGDDSSGLPMEMIVYNSDPFSFDYGWKNESYKTITITSKLSEVTNGDTLLAWLKANATKQ